MKTEILILLFTLISITIMLPVPVEAQTDRELLLKLVEQQAKLSEQHNTTNAKIDAMQKQMDVRFEAVDKRFEAADKRIDILLYVMLSLLAGIFVLVGMVFWDRMTFAKPFEKVADIIKEENKELKAQIIILEEKQRKHESIFKKLAETQPSILGML